MNNFCQNTQTQEDSVCISKDDVKIIFRDLKVCQLTDSINLSLNNIVKDQKTQISGFKNELFIMIGKHTETEKSLNRANKKLKIQGFIIKFGIPIAIISGYFINESIN